MVVGKDLELSRTSTALPSTPSCPPTTHGENITCPDLIIQGFVFDQKLLNSPPWSLVNCPQMVCIIDPGANLGN